MKRHKRDYVVELGWELSEKDFQGEQMVVQAYNMKEARSIALKKTSNKTKPTSIEVYLLDKIYCGD